MSKARRLGTSAETAVVKYLRDKGFIHAERRALRGSQDCGDINLGDPSVMIEVKNHRTMQLAEWMDETSIETDNANASIGLCVHKRRGKGNPGEWYATMTLETAVALLKEHCGLSNWPLNQVMPDKER